MNRHTEDTVGFRYTGWAALNRDPQQDKVEFVCPHCGERAEYHFTDGFVQDVRGEATTCKKCKTQLHVAPVVLLHDQDEKRRFQAVFADTMGPSSN